MSNPAIPTVALTTADDAMAAVMALVRGAFEGLRKIVVLLLPGVTTSCSPAPIIRTLEGYKVVLLNTAERIPHLGRACLPASIIGFFDRAFPPHLEQMQHAPINDPARRRS